MTGTTDIAADFIATAQRAAEAARQQRHEALQEKFGQVYTDYLRELSPVVRAISALPDRDGSGFLVDNPSARSGDFKFSIRYTQPSRLGLWAGTISFCQSERADQLTFHTQTEYDKSTINGQRGTLADFAAARSQLALWFADVAPQRIAELQKLLQPEEEVKLKRNMQASAPIRLKTPEAGSA